MLAETDSPDRPTETAHLFWQSDQGGWHDQLGGTCSGRVKAVRASAAGELVARPQLWVLLGQGVECKLTLISAPAGFGKMTLLAEWVSQRASRIVSDKEQGHYSPREQKPYASTNTKRFRPTHREPSCPSCP